MINVSFRIYITNFFTEKKKIMFNDVYISHQHGLHQIHTHSVMIKMTHTHTP